MTNVPTPGQAMINKWRSDAERLRSLSAQLSGALVANRATASSDAVVLEIELDGTLAAIGFSEARGSQSNVQLSATVLRLHEAALGFLTTGEVGRTAVQQRISVGLSSDVDWPDDEFPRAEIEAPRRRMPAPRPPVWNGSPTPSSRPEPADYNLWMRERLERIVASTAQAYDQSKSVVGEAVTEYLTIKVDYRSHPISVVFSTASNRLDAKRLGDQFAAAYTAAVAQMRAETDALFAAAEATEH